MSAEGGRKRGERRFCPTRGCFLLLLYDKAIACMQEAIELLDAGDRCQVRTSHSRTGHRHGTLDSLERSTGEIACNQERIYLYIYRL